MNQTLYIKIDPFHKTSEIYPFDACDSDLCWLKMVFDKMADGFKDCFQIKVENDTLNKRVIATLVGTEESVSVGYAMVGFKVNQIFHAVRFLAEELGLFQRDEIVCAGQVIHKKEC